MNPNPELIARLTACAAALEHLSNHSGGDYAQYHADRAAQCRSWIVRIEAGDAVNLEDVAAGLQEFEEMAR